MRIVLQQWNIPVINKSTFEFCSAWCVGKTHWLSSLSSRTYNSPLALVYSDLWWPAPLLSLQQISVLLLLLMLILDSLLSTYSKTSQKPSLFNNLNPWLKHCLMANINLFKLIGEGSFDHSPSFWMTKALYISSSSLTHNTKM